jgi:SNF2 family DNA or RNA helicase
MSKEYYIKYQKAINTQIEENGDEEDEDVFTFSNPEKFYNGHRRAVNIAGNEYFSSKLEKIIPIIKNQKTVVFTNWLEFGITPIEKTLKKYKITYKIITGSTTKSQRQEIVNEYNNNIFQVLVITKAGSEGIDLHEVRNLIVLDPVWNYAGLEQIMGRAARYKSHINLPPSKRNVKVFLLVSTEPNITNITLREGESTDSGDRILYDIIRKKKTENKRIMDMLRDKCALK